VQRSEANSVACRAGAENGIDRGQAVLSPPAAKLAIAGSGTGRRDGEHANAELRQPRAIGSVIARMPPFEANRPTVDLAVKAATDAVEITTPRSPVSSGSSWTFPQSPAAAC